MENPRSKRHHYLPQYYLKGFTDEAGSFFVYDKQTDKIFNSKPSDTFFENNLNTITFQDGNSDFLEKMYSEFEATFWPSLDKVRDSKNTDEIDPLDRMNLFFFLSVLHWRLPRNADCAESLSQKFFTEEEFKFFHLKSKTDKPVPEKLMLALRSSEGFKKSAKLMIPFAPFYKKEWLNCIRWWKFSYCADGGRWNIVGDSPIITDGKLNHDPVRCLDRFIFPVSGRILLLNRGDRIQPKQLPPNFILQYNVALLHNAERFVACPDRSILEAIIMLYKKYMDNKMPHLIVQELFSYLD